jgi:IPP transferase
MAGLAVPREVLRLRIEARLRTQMANGFLDEARRLASVPGGPSRTAARALGYQELLGHLRGEVDLDGAVAAAIVNTGRFAVRQERWFRRDPRITWFATDVRGGPADGGRGVVEPGRRDADPNRAEPTADAIDRWWSECAAAGRGSTTTVAPGAPGSDVEPDRNHATATDEIGPTVRTSRPADPTT